MSNPFKLDGLTDIYCGHRIRSVRGAILIPVLDGTLLLVIGRVVEQRGLWVHTRPRWAPRWWPLILSPLEWVLEGPPDRHFCAVVRPQDIQPRETK